MGISRLKYFDLLADDLRAVHLVMSESLARIHLEVGESIFDLVRSGGKRLRPALVLLSAYLNEVDIERVIPLAAAVEMLHTATLIHDDLIDSAALRRGVETLNARCSPPVTVLAGDIVFAWAARLAARGQDLAVMERFSESLVSICEGELKQMFQGRGSIPTVEMYYERIFAKTGSLFTLATEVGPRLAQRPASEIVKLQTFGKFLGQAFQIADDVLDLMGTEAMLGKPVGSDLRQRLITLPLIRYLEAYPEDTRVHQILEHPDDEETMRALITDFRKSDVAERVMAEARRYVEEAITCLDGYPDTQYRQAMVEIATFAVQRRY